MKRKSFLLIIFFIIILINSINNYEKEHSSPINISGINIDLTVHYLDVGQGDASFIELPNKQTILIDGGTSSMSNKIINYIENLGYNKIDYVIATHPHADHIGGLAKIINTFDIDKIYMPKAISTSKTYENLLNTIKDKNLKINTAKANINIINDNNLIIDIIAPNSEKYDKLNNYSAVLKMTYKNISFLFMGDAEEISENEITANVKSDIIKVGHHGSNTSSSLNFVKKVQAKYAIISVGSDNSYNHPNKEVIDRFESMKTKIYRTDLNGNIIITTDGYNIKCEVENESNN